MKEKIIHIAATTGAALIVLAVIGVLHGEKYLYLSSIFETLGAIIVIHLGVALIRKIEIRYFLLEIFIEISFIIAVLIIFGAVFDWYELTPIWILAIMAVLIYLFDFFVSIRNIHADIKTINALAAKAKKQRTKNDDGI
jgi:hypothetical protein